MTCMGVPNFQRNLVDEPATGVGDAGSPGEAASSGDNPQLDSSSWASAGHTRSVQLARTNAETPEKLAALVHF